MMMMMVVVLKVLVVMLKLAVKAKPFVMSDMLRLLRIG